MRPDAMHPYGLALIAYHGGDSAARITVRRDDGVEHALPASHYFRSADEFSPIEVAALGRCRGHVLDIGAGSGLHSLALQSEGLVVTAIDIASQAVEIMTERGVRDAACADVFAFHGGPFDTLLMLGHGIGIVEDLPGLDRFLVHAGGLTRTGGSLLLDSVDVRRTDDPDHLAYHEANRRAGRYVGETRIQLEYAGEAGRFCGWLHVDAHTLQEHAVKAEWACETLLELESGEYLASLTPTIRS